MIQNRSWFGRRLWFPCNKRKIKQKLLRKQKDKICGQRISLKNFLAVGTFSYEWANVHYFLNATTENLNGKFRRFVDSVTKTITRLCEAIQHPLFLYHLGRINLSKNRDHKSLEGFPELTTLNNIARTLLQCVSVNKIILFEIGLW